MHKLSHFESGDWQAFSHPPRYTREQTNTGNLRLCVGVPTDDTVVAGALARCLEPPLHLLYVLHTPRGEGLPGRYQSPLLECGEVSAFLERFSSFLATDARFDLWFYSPSAQAPVVWDRHNLAYAYGAITCYEVALRALGFEEGTPGIPSPHAHNYHAANDPDAKAILDRFAWQRSDLRPEDEQ